MQKKQNRLFFGAVALILCLMLLGIGLILKTYQNYKEQFSRQQEAHQLELAQSVDRNIESLLAQTRNSLEYIISLDSFQTAEETWLRRQGSQELLTQLTENHLSKNDLISCIIALQDGHIMLESQDRTSYQFLNGDEDSLYRLCLGYDGRVYLAVICPGRENAAYASVIDLQMLYQKVSSTELAAADQLLLLDRNASVMLHYCSDSESFKSTLLENCPDREDFQLMLAAEQQQTAACLPFLYQTKQMNKGYHARITILPSGSSENQNFAIGLISNMDTALAPLKTASIRWILGGALILTGICLLLVLALHFLRKDIRIAQELELLQQKTIAMEELQKKTQEVSHHQRLEMMGTLTSGIAHEFNNLLTPIMGYSMLALEQLPPEQEELYDNLLEIYNTSRKAKEITSQLSQYSRKNSGTKTYLNPKLLIEKVLPVALPACPETVSIHSRFDCDNYRIYGDETQLSQLLLNLMINAFHAMAGQDGTLEISASVSNGQLQIALTDSGCGIPETVLPHIFEPFFTTKEGGKGSGLGLAIAQQIAEDHQGHLDVRSKEGKGSTFTLTLPAYYQ